MIAVGFVAAWVGRYSMNQDGMCYSPLGKPSTDPLRGGFGPGAFESYRVEAAHAEHAN
jgi:hypothetical protein